PQIPGLPPAGSAAPAIPELPPQFNGLAFPQIAGLDFAPPAPIPGMTTPSGTTFTVRSNKTSLLGNVKLSYITLETLAGPKPAIRIDADRVVLDNLNVQFPGWPSGSPDVFQRSGPGVITTLNGNFHIIVKSLKVRPELAGLPLPFAIPIDANWAPERIRPELQKIGAGLPDVLSEKTVMLDGELETYYISADDLRGPAQTTLGP
ncbi:hypothetical protein, partial [Corynebacterium heidelbergense]|uniref:hypothetical protein n=2 Tax=Corynebacterium heidelbergense TaxID=2055947 RepID=UPI001EE6995A